MAEYVGDVVGDALRELVVTPAEQSISQYNADAGIFYLNHLMLSLSVDGVSVGFTVVDSFADPLTVDDAAIEPMVKLLAVSMAPLYKSAILSAELIQQAEEAIKFLRDISVNVSVSGFPETLPYGSGNYDQTYARFYSNPDNEILTEQGGNIAPEDIE